MLTPPPTSTRRYIKRPDPAARDAVLKAAETAIAAADAELKKIGEQIGKLSDDPAAKTRRGELLDELKKVRAEQGTLKTQRSGLQDQLKQADALFRAAELQLKLALLKVGFKSVEELDARLALMEAEIAAGTLLLADERRKVKEMLALRKLRKDLVGLDTPRAALETARAKIAELKKQIGAVPMKEAAARYDALQAELDTVLAGNKEAKGQRDTLHQKRRDLHKVKDAEYAKIREARTAYNEEFTVFKKTLAEERKRREEEEKEQRVQERFERRLADADAAVKAAHEPAFAAETQSVHAVLRFFDPSHEIPSQLVIPVSKFTENGRAAVVVEDLGLPVLVKKTEVFFAGTGGKKKKKGGNKETFQLGPDVILQLAELQIDIPASKADVPAVQEQLRARLADFESKQAEQTKANIAKAEKELAKVQAEYEAAKKEPEVEEEAEA